MRKQFLIIWMLLVTFMVCRNLYSPTLPNLIVGVNPSVVKIEVEGAYNERWFGSGVIVHERGIILTAKHVIKDANSIVVIMANGRRYEAIDSVVDPNNDVSIIRIAPLEDLPTVEFGNEVEVGEEVFIIGSPFNMFNSVALGIVSGHNRTISFFGGGPLLQLDIAGNPGNSGCPVFNMNGKIVGILVGSRTNADGVIIVVYGSVCEALLDKYVGAHK